MNTTTHLTAALLTYDANNEAPLVEAIRALVANGETYSSIAKRIEGINATDVRHLHDYQTCANRTRTRSATRAFHNQEAGA
jgi:hypothetical protein